MLFRSPYSYDQTKLIPLSLSEQIQEGTFEYALNYIVDHHSDLSVFDDKYRNDSTGAPAFDPAILLKIVLYAYSRGITSSRKIAQAYEENITFMALSAQQANGDNRTGIRSHPQRAGASNGFHCEARRRSIFSGSSTALSIT